MKISKQYYDQIYDFKGLWDMPSRCGLKLIKGTTKTFILVTELYQDNPGSSITQVNRSLMEQICKDFKIEPGHSVYIECAPEMNSKLSFYEQACFIVDFSATPARYTQVESLKNYLTDHE